MAKINTVLFDFDGTVMNTNDAIIKSWQHTFKTYEGKERPIEEIIKTFGEPLLTAMEKVLPQIPVEESVETYRSYHGHNFGDSITVFPEMIDLLKEVKKRRYKTAVVTSRIRGTTEEGLNKYDMMKYFDYIVTGDECKKHKPDPEPILVALKHLGSTANETIMIGDTMFDILCAKNANVKSVLVGWTIAVTEEEKAGSNKPDYFIDNAMDLIKIL